MICGRLISIPLFLSDCHGHHCTLNALRKANPSRRRSPAIAAIRIEFADANRVFTPSPPDATPCDLFEIGSNKCNVKGYRFIRKGDSTRSQALFFIDGACSNDGAQPGDSRPKPRGGAAVVFAPLEWFKPVKEALPLDGQTHTCNRAELRAAVMALNLRRWLVLGISQYVHKWLKNGWKTSGGSPMKKKDLWEVLLARLRALEDVGCLMSFWLIPRRLNEADRYAKKAAVH